LIEDNLLKWFKQYQKFNDFETKLKDELCIKYLKYCCHSGTWGPNCEQCPKNSIDLICSGNGKCQVRFFVFFFFLKINGSNKKKRMMETVLNVKTAVNVYVS